MKEIRATLEHAEQLVHKVKKVQKGIQELRVHKV
jgi:hypothetical protein